MSIAYTPSQLQAVHHLDGNLQIIACAGSGKTQVLAQRIVNILKEKGSCGIGPENIVAFTFTNKAAVELKHRIHDLCEQQLGKVFGLAGMYVGTIHGFALALLQNHMFEFQKYSVLGDVQQRLLIDRFHQKSGLTDLQVKGKRLERWKDSQIYQRVLGIMREAGIIEANLGHDNPLKESVRKYEELLHSRCWLDFSMLLNKAVDALAKDASIREKMRQQVKYLIVDEYQDVNPLQEQLISRLHGLGAQVCVVGDDDQTIYQWNGSDIRNILEFANRYPNVTTITMDENFRSSEGVVETARRIAELNADGRLKKKMVSSKAQPFADGDLLALDFADSDEEANWIADKILAMCGTPFSEKGKPPRGLSWSDCAILMRSVKNSAEPILKALQGAGIPYVVKGMNGLFCTAEIQACQGIFSYVMNGIDKDRLRQLWEQAQLGLVPDDILTAITWLDGERNRWPAVEAKVDFSLQRTYLGFLERLGVTEEKIPASSGKHLPRGELVFYNLGMFSQLISDFEQINFDSRWETLYKQFNGFLTYQAAAYYPEGWESAGCHQPDAVQVMTIHQSKGMQFPVVFIPNLVANRFPCSSQHGRQWHHVVPGKAVPNFERYLGRAEDERRLFYVALTRSQKFLYCTWAQLDTEKVKRPSEFFDEFIFVGGSYVVCMEPTPSRTAKLPPAPAREHAPVVLTFSELKYYFACPYLFKLRHLYGFDQPLREEVGYGKSLHDALTEIHRRALARDFCTEADIAGLLDRHLHLPYAAATLRNQMRVAATVSLRRYLHDNASRLDKIEHSELPIELKLEDGVEVLGRIDLVRHTDTGEIAVVDFKSNRRAQAEDVTRMQLDIYAIGYHHLTGRTPDLVEIYNLDGDSQSVNSEAVNQDLLDRTSALILEAGRSVRENRCLHKQSCRGCDFSGICGRVNRPV